MAPKFSAPKVWRRPYTSIYNDNYRYGNSLYESAIYNLDRKHQDTLARNVLRGDRIDLQSTTESALSKEVAASRQKALDSALHHVRSISTSRVNDEAAFNRRLQHSESFSAYQSKKALADVELELEESIARRSRSRSRRRPESAYGTVSAFEEALLNDTSDGPNQAFWTERCRELQSEIDSLNHQFADQEGKIKHESALIKNKINEDVNELVMAVDEQDRHMNDLHKMLKRQTQQISNLLLDLEASQRHYADTAEQIGQAQRRCQNMMFEVDEIKAHLDKVQDTAADKHSR